VIKLDRSIIDGVATDPVLTTLVRSLVDFGRGCDASVVAEGIETAGDATALLALGVDYGQGWHYGRPGPADALADQAPRARTRLGQSVLATPTGQETPVPPMPQ
jgi:EAL domain-containing protein (putative c-di-GMP-specific phosphodiesterase class I)